MEGSKISLPADFGIENFDCPGHSNVEIQMKGGKTLKVNSIILGLHSPVFQRMFKDLNKTTVDFTDFAADNCRNFFSSLYDGRLVIEKDTLRDFLKIAAIFKIEWIKSRCILSYYVLVKSFVEEYNRFVEEGGTKLRNAMVDLKWALNEAILARTVFKDPKMFDISAQYIKKGVEDGKIAPFIRFYMTNMASLTQDQLEIAIAVTGTNVKVLMEVLKGSMVSGRGLGKNATYILEHIDLVRCKEADHDLYKDIFNNLLQMRNSLESKKSDLTQANK